MYKVFLSSTARDLSDYRQAVYDAVHRMDDFHCVRMEDFGARDALADDLCRTKVAECDVGVFLVGLCYGSQPEDSEDSYTVREYDAAIAAKRPRLIFVSREEVFYPGYVREPDSAWERQQAFRQRVSNERIRDDFATPDELAGKVGSALSNWVRERAKPAPEKKDGGGVAGGHEDAAVIAARGAYLNRVMAQCGYVSLAGVDPAMAGKQDADTRLSLNAVYTALLTRSTAEREAGADARTELERETRRVSALEQLDRHRLLVLQGEPGSGKSTFANFVALCLAGEALGDADVNLKVLAAPLPDERGEPAEEPQPWRHAALLPVPVVLRDLAATGLPETEKQATASHLWGFIEDQLKAATLAEYAPHLKSHLLEQGGLLLLDGLDEVPEAEHRREQVQQAVEDFVRSHPKCRVLVTSRTYAYQNQGWRLAHFEEAVLAPFSDGQVRGFVRRWYAQAAALGRLSAEDATGRAALLEAAIFGQHRLRELAERPLLLTLMASLHAWRGGNLPEKRERLYADTVELLLEFWEGRRVKRTESGAPVLLQPSLAEWLRADRDQVRAVLEDLAFEAHSAQPDLAGTADVSEDTLVGRLMRLSQDAEANPKRLVEYLRDRAGVLMPRGVGVYTFPHRSFQEYLAACHLTGDSFPGEVARLAREDPDRWREVALLAGAKAARGSSASIWQLADELCYRDVDAGDTGPADQWGAQLAGQALVESAKLSAVSPANQTKLERIRGWLRRLMREQHLTATERVLAGESLSVLRDPRFDPDRWHLPAKPLLGFVELPEGSFLMGSDEGQDKEAWTNEMPQHEVVLPRYYLARWPVTVAQFRAYVENGGRPPAYQGALSAPDNTPVVAVSWHDAMVYCRWLGERLQERARQQIKTEASDGEADPFWQGLAQETLGCGLPSEAEWEKAARGTDGRLYPWGNQAEPERANYDDTGIGRPSPVGCFPRGVSPCGCEEMSGNVWEWTRSLWGESYEPEFGYPYETNEVAREELSAGDSVRRVLRGGAFGSNAEFARCAYRDGDHPYFRVNYVGFRVVVSPFFSER